MKQCFGDVASTGSVSRLCESNNNRLRIKQKVERQCAILVAHLNPRLLLAIINFLNLSDEGSSSTESGCTVLES